MPQQSLHISFTYTQELCAVRVLALGVLMLGARGFDGVPFSASTVQVRRYIPRERCKALFLFTLASWLILRCLSIREAFCHYSVSTGWSLFWHFEMLGFVIFFMG